MKLDYSSKDRNWHIYTPDSHVPIKPKQPNKWKALMPILIVVVVLAFMVAMGLFLHAHFKAKAQPVAAPVQDTATQTVVIPLQLPPAQS